MKSNYKLKVLKNLKKKHQQKYGIAVFDIRLKNTRMGIAAEGKVLTENQKNDIINALENNNIRIKDLNIKVLSDPEKRNEIGWAIVKKGMTDLKSRFVSNKILNKRILERIRCSQAFKGEILRVLYEYEDQLLVQQNDLTLGWVNRKDVDFKKNYFLYKKWKTGNYAIKGRAIKITNDKTARRLHSPAAGTMEPAKPSKNSKNIECHSRRRDRESSKQAYFANRIPDFGVGNDSYQTVCGKLSDKIIKEAEKYLGAKYVLGGKSKKGIDCSGFVQVVYRNALNVILPKHSWDQKKYGKPVRLKDIKSGDLVFLVKRRNGHKHVGIAEVDLFASQLSLSGGQLTPQPPLSGGLQNNPLDKGGRRVRELDKTEINLIHASLDGKKVLRQSLEEVLGSYDFAEARRVTE